MERAIYPAVQCSKEKERISIILLSPILLGAAVYAGSVSIMIVNHIFKLIF